MCETPTPDKNGFISITEKAEVMLDGKLTETPLQVEYSCNKGYLTNPPTIETVFSCSSGSGNFDPAPTCFRG